MAHSTTPDDIDTLVEQWQDQDQVSDPDALQIVARILRLAKILESHQCRLHSQFGLKPGEFDVLAALRRSPEPALTPSQLHQTMLLSSGAMTCRLDRLEKKQLIRRKHCTHDRRSVNVSLTKKGSTLIDEILPAHFDLLSSLLAPMSDSDKARLTQLLRNCLSCLPPLTEQKK